MLSFPLLLSVLGRFTGLVLLLITSARCSSGKTVRCVHFLFDSSFLMLVDILIIFDIILPAVSIAVLVLM